MHEAIDYNALSWVRQELSEILNQARLKLEAFAHSKDDPELLHDCAAFLHEARGPLQMVELKGADRLAECWNC
jgi:chemosensory pili system protein ChpA (sensor histidine kinase/response regulator)